MAKTFCLLNHKLTENQIADLETNFNSIQIVYPDDELSKQWSQINPEQENDGVIKNAVAWLQDAQKEDLLVIQGEYGCTFKLVDYALKKGLIPIYATTKRIAKEVYDGEKVHREYIFEHVCFKKYKYYQE